MRVLILLSVLAFAACYRPTLPAGQFECATGADCPDHLVCGGGYCVDPSQLDLAAGPDQPSGADLGVDLAAAARDLSPPPDLTSAEPCAAGWIEISPQSIYACKRAFAITAGNFAGLCRPGYHVCNGSDRLDPVTMGGTAGKCLAAGGFFLSQIEIAMKSATSAECDPARFAALPRALLGCGSDLNTVPLSGDCDKLRVAVVCSMPAPNWSCTTTRDARHTVNDPGGLLCCRD